MVKIFLRPSLHKAKSQGSKTYNESTLFPVLTIDRLLPAIEKEHYLSRVQDIVSLPDDYFEAIYVDLIDRFALYVQVLPESYGEELGGLLNDGLRRAFLAIQILHETHEGKPHPLFVFTVFSIALLADIGQVLQYHVMISDDKGNFLDDWYPYVGPMNDIGNFYKLRPYDDTPQSLMRGSTPILGRQLLSETAMTWLSSNNQMLDMWLAFLNKGEDWAGGLCKLLKIDPKQYENRLGETSLFPIDVKTVDPMATELGEKFLAWLKAGLLDGSISYNEADSKVHVFKANDLEYSVFLQAPELFQQFCNIYSISRDWVVVCKQFNYLGFGKMSGTDVKFEQFFSDTVETKANKMSFLGREKGVEKKVGFTEQNVTPSRAISANSIKEGVVVKDAKNIFGAQMPPASQFLKQIDIKWRLDSVLPKLRETKKGQGATLDLASPSRERPTLKGGG